MAAALPFGSPTTASGTKDPIGATADVVPPRAFSGVTAPIADLPLAVVIVNTIEEGACTGSFIEKRWVLTAVNRFDRRFTVTIPNLPEILVLAGLDPLTADWPEVHTVERAVHHPSWNPPGTSVDHDIALLRLATPTSFPPMGLTAPTRTVSSSRVTATTPTGWCAPAAAPQPTTPKAREAAVSCCWSPGVSRPSSGWSTRVSRAPRNPYSTASTPA